MPTDIVNASEQTVESTPPVSPEITEDAIKAHPLYQELETKHAAARQGLDKYAVENKQLKKALIGEESTEQPQEPKPATIKDIETTKEQIKWELRNEEAIKIADQNGLYSNLLSEGKTPQDALDLALYREGLTSKSASSETMRQAAASSPSAGIDRTNPDSPIDGFPKAEYDKMKAMGLSDTRIREIVGNALQRASKRR